ncbi:MAG: calcium-binding protein [Actinomycetota bacterium]
MKKRSAAVAALSLGLFQALGVLGAVPASAAAPTVVTGGCSITNYTLFAYGEGSTDSARDGYVDLQMDGDMLECTYTVAGAPSTASIDPSKFTDVVVAVEGDLTFLLEDAGDSTGYVGGGDFPDADWTVAADAIIFDGSGVTDPRDEFDVTVSDDSLEMNGISADVNYVAAYEFGGTINGDDFDASDASIDVIANGSYGGDTLAGGDGEDSLDGDYGNDVLYGNDGEDDLNCREPALDSTDGDKSYAKEADQCWGGADDDLIEANAPDGEDGATSYAGYDTVAPGDGDDDFDEAYALYYGDSSEAITVSLDDQEVTSDAGDDIWDGSVFAVIGSAEDDTLIGTDGDDSLTGGGGADTILGRSGDDELAGGGGNDTISGGAGDDAIKANGGDDKVKGSGGADIINGGGGDDVLYGNKGADTLLGKAGDDQAWGGGGKDLCVAEVKDSCEFAQI